MWLPRIPIRRLYFDEVDLAVTGVFKPNHPICQWRRSGNFVVAEPRVERESGGAKLRPHLYCDMVDHSHLQATWEASADRTDSPVQLWIRLPIVRSTSVATLCQLAQAFSNAGVRRAACGLGALEAWRSGVGLLYGLVLRARGVRISIAPRGYAEALPPCLLGMQT
jgi:hypothetical protein